MSIDDFLRGLDSIAYGETGAIRLHELEPFNIRVGKVEVVSKDMVLGELAHILTDIRNAEPQSDTDIAYKLHRFGGPEGPVHAIEYGWA